MNAGFVKRSTEFARNERGTIALLYAVIFMTFALVTGMAIDYSRMVHMKTRVAAAADAATLAAGQALFDGRLTDAEVETLAVERFNYIIDNAGGLPGTAGSPTVTIDRESGTVDIDVSAMVPLTFMKMAGFEDDPMPVAAAVKFDIMDIDLGLALDVTGSMGGSKIADLKAAAKDLIDILLPDGGSPSNTRIGLAPYATSVNAGDFAPDVTGVPGAQCVYERAGSEAFKDTLPADSDLLGYSAGVWCPSAKVTPITANKTQLKSSINGYSANGWTAGHLGAAWAWYLVSPKWASIWPAASEPLPYGATNTQKIVVLMTDGEFNTQYILGNGNSSQQAVDVCDEMKNEGVMIYSVAFQAPASAQATLQTCATSGHTYYNATNGNELRVAFRQIATSVSNLRVTK